MANLWGFAAGEQAAQATQQHQQMVNIATAEAPLRMQAMENANKLSQMAIQRQAAFNNAMEHSLHARTGGAQGQDTLSNQLREMAQLSLESGDPQMSAKYISSYTQYERNKTTLANNQQKLAIQHAKLIDNLMQGVHDESSWRAANAAYMMETGQPSPFGHIPFAVAQAQGLIGRIQAATMTAVQKATVNKDNAQASAAKANAALSPLREQLIKKQIKESEARTVHLEKEGGAPPVKAMGDNLKILTDLANKEYRIDPTRQAAVRAIMRPWAEKMISVQRSNPDMTPTQAAQRVFQEAQQAHTFAGFQGYQGLHGDTPANAIPYKGDKNLKDNMWYQTNKGPLLYQKGKFYTEQEVKATELH